MAFIKVIVIPHRESDINNMCTFLQSNDKNNKKLIMINNVNYCHFCTAFPSNHIARLQLHKSHVHQQWTCEKETLRCGSMKRKKSQEAACSPEENEIMTLCNCILTWPWTYLHCKHTFKNRRRRNRGLYSGAFDQMTWPSAYRVTNNCWICYIFYFKSLTEAHFIENNCCSGAF